MLFWLYFLKLGRGFECLFNNRNAAQEFRVEGGVNSVFQTLARDLAIQFEQQVVEVRQLDNGQYLVTTKDKHQYYADKIISAIPANLINRIAWQPNLEMDRLKLYSGMRMGKVTKLVVKYEQPFWRESGYTGECISDTPPITACFDGSTSKYSALIIFVAYIHDKIDEYTNNEILDHLAKLLDDNRAKMPTKVYRKDWVNDEFSGGGYFSVPRIGDSYLYSYLTKPYNNIYFIGTETANEWYGYIEGALESAQRVVKQINPCNIN